MEPEGSLPYSQVPATSPYPEPDQSCPCSPSHILMIHINIILPSIPGSSKWSLSFTFPCQGHVYTSPFPICATCPALLVLLEYLTSRRVNKKCSLCDVSIRFSNKWSSYCLKSQWQLNVLSVSMHCVTRRGVPGSIPGKALRNFQVTYIFMSVFSRPAVYSASDRNEYQGVCLRVKCGRRLELTIPASQLCRMSK